MQRRFLKTLSQNPEFVKTHCNDLYNPFRFAYRKYISEKSSQTYNIT